MAESSSALIKTLIVDDEPLAVDRLTALCQPIPRVQIVGAAQNGATALKLIDTLRPDLILLDVAMPEMDGMQVARAIAQRPTPPAVIFVTAFAEFAVEAFDIAAVDYLLKPVAPDRLMRALDRVTSVSSLSPHAPQNVTDYAAEFWVPHRSELIRISVDEIEKIEAERDYMRLYIHGRSYLLHQTITALEKRLDPKDFIRLHRSAIVRRSLIARLGHDGAGAWHAEMSGGGHIRIGRTFLQQVKALAGK